MANVPLHMLSDLSKCSLFYRICTQTKKQSDKNNFPIQTRIKQKMQKKILCFTLWDIKTTVWDTYFTL